MYHNEGNVIHMSTKFHFKKICGTHKKKSCNDTMPEKLTIHYLFLLTIFLPHSFNSQKSQRWIETFIYLLQPPQKRIQKKNKILISTEIRRLR